MKMENKAFINLRISGEGLNLQEITARLEMSPDYAYKKGDVFIDHKHGGQTIVYQEDCWIAGIESIPKESIGQSIERFLELLKPVSGYLKELAQRSQITVWASIYPENEQMNIHLSSTTIAILHSIGVSFDGSVMFLKQFYDGTYERQV